MSALALGNAKFAVGGMKLGLAPNKGPAFIRGAAVDLRFDIGRYRLNGQSVSLAAIDAYHSRASNSWGQNAQGIWQEFPSGQMEVFPGLGYDGREGHTVLNGNPLDPRLWSITRASVSNEIGAFLGFSSARRVATDGNIFSNVQALITGGLISGTVYAVRALYAVGSSGRARLIVRNGSGAVESRLNGAAGALTSGSTAAGTWSNIVNINHGGGINEIQAIFTATSTGASAMLALGPDSTTVGQDIIVIAGQVVQRPYQVPFGVGTVAADTLVIPAADAGMAVNPSVTGLTAFWRGVDFESSASFPRLLEIRSDSSNRLSLFRDLSNGSLNVSFLSAGAGASAFASLASTPMGVERTVLVTWRPDGTRWVKIGANAVSIGSRAPIAGSLSAIGIGNDAVGTSVINHITRRAGFLSYSLSDADALSLFNQINQGL